MERYMDKLGGDFCFIKYKEDALPREFPSATFLERHFRGWQEVVSAQECQPVGKGALRHNYIGCSRESPKTKHTYILGSVHISGIVI